MPRCSDCQIPEVAVTKCLVCGVVVCGVCVSRWHASAVHGRKLASPHPQSQGPSTTEFRRSASLEAVER
jgi:hypothetical protein